MPSTVEILARVAKRPKIFFVQKTIEVWAGIFWGIFGAFSFLFLGVFISRRAPPGGRTYVKRLYFKIKQIYHMYCTVCIIHIVLYMYHTQRKAAEIELTPESFQRVDFSSRAHLPLRTS